MREEAFRFGDGDRLFGILTLPDDARVGLPVFVYLSSGLLHRVGPRRLYVRLARRLATRGFASFRLDLSGRGDSLVSPGVDHATALSADWATTVTALESRLGPVQLVPGGLCSAADDAIRIARDDERVVGMILLDPVCERDGGFKARELKRKYANPARYRRWLRTRLLGRPRLSSSAPEAVDPLSLRDAPSTADTVSAFEAVRDRGGKVFSLFTSYATGYLNDQGQMGRVLGVKGYETYCRELFWPSAAHSLNLEAHRRRAIAEILEWATED